MSGLYGLVRLDGPDVTEAELGEMRAPMAAWGRDGGATWRDGCAGFGQLVTHRTPEDRYERGPLVVAGGTIVVTPAGRIDNRAELCVALGVPGPDRSSTSDGRLMALAYERWGEHATQHLLGDWAFAAWHPADRRLVLARDHYGHSAVYWHRSGSSLAFASSLKGLLALPGVPRRLDELRLAETLVICAARGEPTLYEDIQRLQTARILMFDGAGVRVREHWSLLDVPEVRLPNDEAYVEQLLDLLGNAVRVRLRSTGPVATTLSAGLDSAAVTAIAAKELGGAPFTAFTSRPAYPEVAAEMPGLLVDEWDGAGVAARPYPQIRHVEVRGEDVTPLAAIDRSIEVHEEPEHAVPNLPWVTALLDRAAQDGGVLLTGQMGNGSISWPGDDRRALGRLAAGDFPDALRALRHARAEGRGGWRGGIWRAIVRPARQLVAAERMRRDPTRQPGLATGLFAAGFADRMDTVEHVRAVGWDPLMARASARERRLSYLLPGKLPVTAWWAQRSAMHGIDVRDPTIDVPLLEFCVGVPDAQFARDGRDRWLIRRGLEGLVPDEVRWNERRGSQGADIARRLRADAPAVSEAIERLRASDVVVDHLDVEQIARHWSAVGAGSSDGVLELSRGLLLGRFLMRCFDDPPM